MLHGVAAPRVSFVLHLFGQLNNLRVGSLARCAELPLHELQLLPHGLVLLREPHLLLLSLLHRFGFSERDGVSHALPLSEPESFTLP